MVQLKTQHLCSEYIGTEKSMNLWAQQKITHFIDAICHKNENI